MDATELAANILAGVRAAIERVVSPLSARLKAIEDRPSPKDGRDGADGKAVEVDQVRAMVAEEFGKLPIPAAGRDGVDGKSVDHDVARDWLAKMVADVHKAQDGRDGRDGDDGRDAAQIEVLDGIDPSRRYQRGTFATHRGGMVRARRQTDCLPDGAEFEKSGWQVVMCGVAELDVEFSEDQRTVKHLMRMTDGRVVTKTTTFPVTIYREVWREDEDYQRGDSTTRDGCTWVLMTDKQLGKPGDEGSGWKMSTKRGRDGKDGPRGDRGPPGRDSK